MRIKRSLQIKEYMLENKDDIISGVITAQFDDLYEVLYDHDHDVAFYTSSEMYLSRAKANVALLKRLRAYSNIVLKRIKTVEKRI